MAVCPNGHDSASEDFCDVCGMRIAVSPASGQAPVMGAPGASPGPVPESAVSGEPCPRCGVARSGQFCEACGFNFGSDPSGRASWPAAPPAPLPPAPPPPSQSLPAPPPPSQSLPAAPPAPPPPAPPVSPNLPGTASTYAPAAWTAVVSSDRDYYETVRAASAPDGAAVPFPAYCTERRFRLTGNQMRIGRRSVSRGLEPEIDLTGPPVDPGISRLHAVLIAAPDGSWSVLDPGSANGTLVNGSEIPTGDQVPLYDGDRINLGAWTVITVHRG
jgi:FHA domain